MHRNFMRKLWLLLALAAATPAQSPPRIGTLQVFGLKRVSEAKIRQTLGVREGDFLPPSKGNAEENLDKISGVVESHLEAVCCDEGKVILYVGIEERGAPHFELRDAPEGDARLPHEVLAAYRRFQEVSAEAVRHGSTAEDLTQGYSRKADLTARAVQDMFPTLAADHLAALRAVLRDSEDEDQRAAAAYIMGYSPDRKTAVAELQSTLKDADAEVRGIAAHNLTALAVYARLNPKEGVKVEPTWFIEMLNSLSWSDRNRALTALQILTDSRDPSVLRQLNDRALQSLVEMARWKTLEHALPAFVLLGRIAGYPDQEIQDQWSKDRDKAVTAALARMKRP
jgi:hypothetical protein